MNGRSLYLLHAPKSALDDAGLGRLGQRVGGEAPEHEPAFIDVTATHHEDERLPAPRSGARRAATDDQRRGGRDGPPFRCTHWMTGLVGSPLTIESMP